MSSTLVLMMQGSITDLLSKALINADFPTLADPCKKCKIKYIKLKVLVKLILGSSGEIWNILTKKEI